MIGGGKFRNRGSENGAPAAHWHSAASASMKPNLRIAFRVLNAASQVGETVYAEFNDDTSQ